MENHHFFMGKSTISTGQFSIAILTQPEGNFKMELLVGLPQLDMGAMGRHQLMLSINDNITRQATTMSTRKYIATPRIINDYKHIYIIHSLVHSHLFVDSRQFIVHLCSLSTIGNSQRQGRQSHKNMRCNSTISRFPQQNQLEYTTSYEVLLITPTEA